MSELPVNWVRTPLEVLGQWGSGGTPKRTNPEYYEGGKIPWLIIGDLNDDVVTHSATHITKAGLANSSAKLLPAETLLIAMYGSIGKLGITGFECATNQAIAFCKPDDNVTTLRYLFYALMDAKSALLAQGQGGAQQNISQGILKAHEVPLAPINEQKRIADNLDAVLARVDACRNRLDRIPLILKRFRQSVLAAATSGKLTEEWRAVQIARMQPQAESRNVVSAHDLLTQVQSVKRIWAQSNPGHNEASRVRKRIDEFSALVSDAGDIPENWCWTKLEDVTLMVVDCHNKTAPYESDGVALVRTPNVRDGRFNWNDLRYVSDDTYKFWSKRCIPEPGDIVFTREAPMGEAAIIPVGSKICLGQRTMLIRPVESCYPARFLLISLLDPKFKERSAGVAVGTGVKHYRVGDVSDLLVSVPPVDEQTEIIRRVETLFAYADRLEARYTAARTQVEKLTPATLAKAFRGELVPQDPNDEPASVLLKRIRANCAPAKSGGRKQNHKGAVL